MSEHGFERRRGGAFAQALECRQQSLTGILLICGSEDDHGNGGRSDGGSETGANQPAEAPGRMAFGVVDGKHVPLRPTRAGAE